MTKSVKAKSRDESYRDRLPKKCCENCRNMVWGRGDDSCGIKQGWRDFSVMVCGICDEYEARE